MITMTKTRILTVCGTRPEAIKLAPVAQAALNDARVEHRLCATAQHRQMLDQVLGLFRLTPDDDLDIMKPNQSLTDVTAAVLHGVGAVIDSWKPDWVIVQGDTTTAFSAALAAFYRQTRVAHVEAGLRTGNMLSPWPEEGNRRLIGQVATIHFPPTEWAADNLRRESFLENTIQVTGNTVIDALHWVSAQLDQTPDDGAFDFLDPAKRLILVTGHRRENFDGGLERVCHALAQIGQREDVEILYPVHLNPNVQATAKAVLGNSSNVHLIGPQDYLPFVRLMRRAYLIVTDSGGIQEEAPALGKPVLVTRDTTERPEAIQAGTARLIGTSAESLVSSVSELLDNADAYAAMAQAKNPFGDGLASQRIIDRLVQESNRT